MPTLNPLKQRRHDFGLLETTDYRQPWAMDVDRILHSKAYTRYIDKTQVFYLLKNDLITHRVLHVQMVSRIARTIGREIELDVDLIEAVALGHDLGHAPFGHDGERFLSEICQKAGLGNFVHAVMSVHALERLEKNGAGLNLTLGVLDGILCHDGESDFTNLKPEGPITFEEFDRRVAIRQNDPLAHVFPMSPEGCLVRLCDSISYVGRDLEDAIEIGLISRDDLPKSISEILGNTNGKIVYRLVDDLTKNCLKHKEEGLVAFSKETAAALTDLKNFNREKIYYNQAIKVETPKIKHLYEILFERLGEEFSSGAPKLLQAGDFWERLSETYIANHSPAEMARDCVASMTDEYFIRLANDILIPGWRVEHF